jgi:hypothetical protein
MNCERCLTIHGPGCAASYQGEDGKAICVFCADSVLCPTQLQIVKGIRHSPTQTVVGLVKQLRETTEARKPQEDQMIDTTAVTARSCKISGCKGKLASNNTTGYCHEHRGRGPHSKKTTGNGASVAVAPKHAYGVQPVAAERVNLLLAAIPLEDKLAFCSAWLAGKS